MTLQSSPITGQEKPRDYSAEMLIGVVASFLGSLLVYILTKPQKRKKLYKK